MRAASARAASESSRRQQSWATRRPKRCFTSPRKPSLPEGPSSSLCPAAPSPLSSPSRCSRAPRAQTSPSGMSSSRTSGWWRRRAPSPTWARGSGCCWAKLACRPRSCTPSTLRSLCPRRRKRTSASCARRSARRRGWMPWCSASAPTGTPRRSSRGMRCWTRKTRGSPRSRMHPSLRPAGSPSPAAHSPTRRSSSSSRAVARRRRRCGARTRRSRTCPPAGSWAGCARSGCSTRTPPPSWSSRRRS
mmetsp:Transcript_22062/g.54973  ORF Transcript_22062/g.54973 Transcript_22062/m.54973 type:complete len:247 (-) Transcript_22062:358-1098(-)